jgi:hypothetical protein
MEHPTAKMDSLAWNSLHEHESNMNTPGSRSTDRSPAKPIRRALLVLLLPLLFLGVLVATNRFVTNELILSQGFCTHETVYDGGCVSSAELVWVASSLA